MFSKLLKFFKKNAVNTNITFCIKCYPARLLKDCAYFFVLHLIYYLYSNLYSYLN